MEVKSQNARGINYVYLFLIGSIILAGSVVTYLFVIKGVFGHFSMTDFIPKENKEELFIGTSPKIAILHSNFTENMLEEGSTWLADNLNTWKRFLSNTKYNVTEINDQDLEKGILSDYELLILPGTKSLSDRERMEIKKFLDRGGSVFASGGTGSYSEDGKWRGWEFFSEVFGLTFSREIDNNEVSKIHTLRGSLPITANIPTGYPLKIATWDRPIAAEVLDPRTIQVSYWYNYRLEDGLVREEIKKTAGIAYGTYGAGRFIWYGFELNSVLGVQEDFIFFDRLFRNSMNWLSYKPIAFVKEWPAGYDAAAIIAPVLSDDKDNNVYNLLGVLSKEKIRASFYLDSYTAESNSSLTKKIASYGEIGTLIDIGFLESVNDTVNKLDDKSIQISKLRDSKKRLEKIINKEVVGFYPINGLYDPNTINALIESGFKYVVTDSLTDRSVPKAILREKGRVLSLTKTARDDYEIIRDFNLNYPEFQFYTYQEDIDRILFEGGLYILKIHPELQCKADNVHVVSDVIKDLKQKKYWIATAQEIQDWYSKKSNVEIRVDKKGRERISVTISNPGNEAIQNLVVNVELNKPVDNVQISSELIGTKPAKVVHKKEEKLALLYLTDLSAGESRTYYLDYKINNI